nr:nucleotide-binding alpha-beta plait domain-containing protein [Tanacetum cinerariifolium]
MGSQRSKEDEVFKISTSVFVTNFPDQFNAKELWNTFKQYGFVVDAFIPTKRSKAGKRFSFVHFINVFNAERLVNNLCTIWIGRYKIHANIARFQRAPMNNSSSQFKNNEAKRNYTYTYAKGHANSYLHAVKGFQKPNLGNESNPVLVLDDSCLNQQDYSYCLLGKVMFEFTTEEVKNKFQSCTTISSWFSQIQQATCNFTTDGRVSWVEVEGIPLKMWSENTFKRIASKWGVLIHVDDHEDSVFHSKRICISTTTQFIISESFRITYKGKSYWIRAKEVPGWVPDFVEDTDDEDESDDDDEGEPKGVMLGDSDVEAVPDTMFEEVLPNANEGDAPSVRNKEMHSEDPFNIYDLLKVKKVPSADSLKYPPGFTPNDDIEDGEVQSAKRKDSAQEKDEGIQNIHEDDVSSEVRKSDLKMHNKENDRLYINMEFPRKLSSTQQTDLEIDVSNEEIKKVVWDCGIDKSPGSDGFTFGFYRHFWKLIEKDVVDAVKYFFKHGALPKGSNSSFIALIPRTPGAKMVKDFRPISLIGSFYKIIAKILANRLIFVLGDIVIGFCGGYTDSSRPFHFKRAFPMEQGDPISPFLFIIIMESLHILLQRVVDAGLRINMYKSKLMGISVGDERVNQAASKIGCLALKVPFSYLGTKVGGIMSRIHSWKEIIDCMVVRLSKWKMKTLSIG